MVASHAFSISDPMTTQIAKIPGRQRAEKVEVDDDFALARVRGVTLF
jgi:hypothetical protein